MHHTVENMHSCWLKDVILVTVSIRVDNYYAFFPKVITVELPPSSLGTQKFHKSLFQGQLAQFRF